MNGHSRVAAGPYSQTYPIKITSQSLDCVGRGSEEWIANVACK